MMMTMTNSLMAGAMAGESTREPQPCESWFTSIPSTAGSPTMPIIESIMPTASTWMTAPMRTCSVRGMVNGAMSVETRMVPSASGVLPPYIPTHMNVMTPTGTQYSSRMPVTISGEPAKNARPRP